MNYASSSNIREVIKFDNLGDKTFETDFRKYKAIFDVAVDENGFPQIPVKYYRSCRADFTHKKSLQDRSTSSDAGTSSEKQTRKSTRNVSQGSSSIIEPDRCMFCKKTKYRTKER